jgi:hypothetical protein
MNRVQFYRLHKWTAISAGAFFLSWMISGIVMIWPGRASERRLLKPDYRTAVVSPAQAAARAGGGAGEMALLRIGEQLVYQFKTGSGIRLVNAHSGELFPITAGVAEHVVRSEYLPASKALRTERLDRHDWEYRSGPLPVYRIRAAGSGKRYYVSAQDGAVRIITNAGRVRSAIMGMHTFAVVPLIGGETRLRKVALFGAALIGLGAAVTGYLIAFPRGWKRRKNEGSVR